MDTTALLADCYDRVREEVHSALSGIGKAHLNERPDEGTNSVSWLIWHLTRVQDDHIADAAAREQVWHAQGFEERFGFGLPTDDTGFGHGPKDVAAVRVDSPDLLLEYHDAVHEQTLDFLRTLSSQSLGRVIDDAWDPPVTLGVRLVSVIGDDMQHAGQAAFLRGILERRH
ncbi:MULTISPECIES: mycothiol transferase [unclassified Streptomyces]|uniref:mycothiol transferase n=1 Tax=unclassified Streptomyces TaxID=2593676 RepID=UPI002DD91459|nr:MULTISPECIES: DinB family protein [unclassified Streptomyces]WSA93529.1 DinB family protein [Streptomyces sp. NBC_01795]WSB77899.1 DinB family protein [Streptomyces sp. NBC_01775]WSS13843.1 DinB family protein [Streptomyces sp. NBC_01186]WSS42669.1 DinB family protein [Streptomyces sp. NBC_01187]